ncbi:MAG: hydrogenase maturation protease [Hyphomicrobiales bacterium]|nr:hydrogenase maturation protease [Hyphomicrobiales bacterium]
MRIIGFGNPFRGDDAAGPIAAGRLQALGFDALIIDGDGTELIAAWEGYDAVIILDAMRSGAAPGTVRRIDANAERLSSGVFHYSSHAFGLAEAIESARALGLLPQSLVIYGIEGADFSLGAPLHPEVEAAAAGIAAEISGRCGLVAADAIST